MIDTSELYRIAEDEDIFILDFSLPNTLSCAVREDWQYAIGIDHRALSSAVDLRERLAHEVGHCVTDSFYNEYSRFDIREKHEHIAEKWAIKKLIPKDELEKLLSEIDANTEYIAEFFGVSLDLLNNAIDLYFA